MKLDKNGDGFLVLDEFKYVFSEISSHKGSKSSVSEEDIKRLFLSLDINNSGKIDYSGRLRLTAEFLAIFVLNGIYQYESYLKDIFKKLDLNKDGKISKQELEGFFNSQTPFLYNQSIAEVIKEIDLNNDGEIDLEEMVTHMRTKRAKEFEQSAKKL